jgi:hypothetical protein
MTGGHVIQSMSHLVLLSVSIWKEIERYMKNDRLIFSIFLFSISIENLRANGIKELPQDSLFPPVSWLKYAKQDQQGKAAFNELKIAFSTQNPIPEFSCKFHREI